MQYRSLLEYIKPKDRIFNYVWSVHATPEGIYYQTNERLFRFRNSSNISGAEDWQVDVWRPQERFGYTFWIDDTLYVQQFKIGLMRMVNDSLMLMPGGEQFANDRIHVMLPFPGRDGNYLIGTFSRGLLLWDRHSFQPWHTDVDALLHDGTVYSGGVTPDSCFALGTLGSGLFIINALGKIRDHFTQDAGLLSNSISCLFVDRQKNLWVGMDGGVVVLEYNSPLSEFSIPGGTGPSDFRRFKDVLYIAANDGVYYLDTADGQFKTISGISGNAQSFFFREINNELFVTTNSGVHHIQGKTAAMVLPNEALSEPILSMSRLSVGENIYGCGLINGVLLSRYNPQNPNRFERIGRVEGVHEYVRSLTESEPGVVWLSTMDAGTLCLTFDVDHLLNPTVERFEPEQGLPPGGASVFKIGDRLFITAKQGVLRFDPVEKKFAHDPFFDDVGLGRNPDEGLIVSDKDGNLWVNLGKESAVYKKLPNGDYRLEKDELARFADEVINTIYPEDNGVVWFGTANNVIRVAPNRDEAEQTEFPAIIRRVAIAGDSVVYFGAAKSGSHMDNPVERKFPFRYNALRFDFSASSYLNPRANQFRGRLEGFEKDWSAWSVDTRRYYTNLPAGKYHFRVQARNIFQHKSQEDIYAFTITPPLYGTWWAWSFYILGAAGLVFGLVRLRTRQLQERSRVLEKTVLERTTEIQAQKDNVEQLSHIGRDITDNLSIKDIINTVYENINRLMDAPVFGIGLHQAHQQALVFPATKEKGETLPEFAVPLNDDSRLAVWCFKNQKDVIINDYGMDYIKYIQELKPAMAGENPESILYLPLQHKEKTIGVITAQSFKKNAYTNYHLNILRNLATYSAIALENADAYYQVNELLNDLKNAQDKLVTQSKLAALGALTAGIAHEIKNPLNFVNNFAELSGDLVQELREEISKKLPDKDVLYDILLTLEQNSGKIKEHGKRADSIVRSMLQHSRGKAGERQPTDINAMLEEDINLAYHGMRAQDSSFNIKIETDLDPSIGKLDVVSQDISRVFLNIINNGCYETHRKKIEQNGSFSPTLSVRTRNLNSKVEIRIGDNGNGIPTGIRDKLHTPFFTTKPAGQGTGLGLSISYDIIVHAHHGELYFDSKEDEYTEFVITLPRTINEAIAE
ncbi:GAF domain-containing protein [candidate division KSB1 bacterium]|nr:GAF domain-containing protein [candidate division KSB1 bacterium]